jgi:MFS family permease
VAAVAAAGGPSLGGLITDGADWRWIFLVNVPVGVVVFLRGRRVLTESRDASAARTDLLATGLLTAGVGLLAFALVQSSEWGWGDDRVAAALVVGAVVLVLFALRSRGRSDPVIEPALLRIRSFSVANAATLAFAAALFAKIFCDVLFLSTVWHWSPLASGLAITPGPLITAAVAGPAGRLADRYGPRAVAAPGALIYAAGCAWYALRTGAEPAYVADWLPGTVLTGIGCGLALPIYTSAAVSEVPAARFGTASAVNSMARQLGAVLGIAMLVAIVGHPSPAGALAAFDAGWIYATCAALVAAVATLALGRVRAGAGKSSIAPRVVAEPAERPLPKEPAITHKPRRAA